MHVNCRCGVVEGQDTGNDLVFEDGVEIWSGSFVKVPKAVSGYVESTDDETFHTTRYCDAIDDDPVRYAKRTWHTECPECRDG